MKTERKNEHYLVLQQAFDTPWPGLVGGLVTLEKGNIYLQIHPHDGARITPLKTFDSEILCQWQSQRRASQYGCFSMVPWAGRLGNATLDAGGQCYSLPANKPPHALHSMACYSTWEIIDKTAGFLTLRMSLASPRPWQGEVTQALLLRSDALVLQLEVHSYADAFPVSAGWHPRFTKKLTPQNTESLQVLFNADWQEETDSDELPTGNRISPQVGPWGNCFGFYDEVRVRLLWPDKLAMTMTSSANSLVVSDKQPDATCVNPLTQAPNAINLTPGFVTPDKPLVIETRWQSTPKS